MSERAQRIGLNEAVFREVNERIETLNRGIASMSDNMLHVVCECGALSCIDQFPVPVEQYERVRSDPALFLVRPGHEIPDVESVMQHHDEYLVIRKDAGEPQLVAEATDPRR